jgi:predicted membrane protein (TIGR00267 family)
LGYQWLRRHLQVSDVLSIARRWFITNAFDGNLSILGLILGTRAVGTVDSTFIVGAGLGICGALAISQSTGNIVAERAERVRELKQLQRAMLRPMEDTVHGRSARTAPLVAGLLGGAAPAAYTALSLIPFLLQSGGYIDLSAAVYLSIVTILASVFVLGVLLGRIAKSSMIISGMKMVGIGGITALALFFFGAR